MPHAVSDEALDTLFRTARSHNRWTDEPVSDALLMAVYDLMRWGPTSGQHHPGADSVSHLDRGQAPA